MKELLLSPALIGHTAEALVGLVSLLFSIFIPAVALRVNKLTKVKIEEKHMKALHEAVTSWTYTAVRSGKNVANAQAIDSLAAYLRASVPDAMAALRPSADVLITLAARYAKGARE